MFSSEGNLKKHMVLINLNNNNFSILNCLGHLPVVCLSCPFVSFLGRGMSVSAVMQGGLAIAFNVTVYRPLLLIGSVIYMGVLSLETEREQVCCPCAAHAQDKISRCPSRLCMYFLLPFPSVKLIKTNVASYKKIFKYILEAI